MLREFLISGIVVCLTFASASPLRFRKDGMFKVLQLADLHYGEAENLDWGPAQDAKSTRAIKAVLEAELPDLVVFTGDQVTGNNVRTNATAYWQEIVQGCDDMGIRWASVFGNHDTLPCQENCVGGRDGLYRYNLDSFSTTTRHALMTFDASHPLSCSIDGHLPDGKAVSNFVLDIMASDSEAAVTAPARLYFFDTGGGDYPEVVYADQVEWFQNVSSTPNSKAAASFAYFHVPLREYAEAWGRDGCVGMNENGGVTPVDADGGLFSALAQAGVRATFVGHDHGNDWCCPSGNGTGTSKGLWFCFGRHSGYGGYGQWARGARVLELQQSSTGVSSKSWVRLESGEKLHEVVFDDMPAVVV